MKTKEDLKKIEAGLDILPHSTIARGLEDEGFYVSADSEDNERSYIYGDRDAEEILGVIVGDAEAKIEITR